MTAASSSDAIRTFDSARTAERRAFVDALKLLEQWGVVHFSAGELESYVTTESGNALIDVDGSRLHRLIASARAPSSLFEQDTSFQTVVAELCAEPRYGDNPEESQDPSVRTKWIRHRVARRLLDDPVVYDFDLSSAEQDYVHHPSGRRWLLERTVAAGFIVEERTQGRLLVDPDRIATDERFPAPNDNVKQAALLLVERFTLSEGDGRTLLDVTVSDVEGHVRELLRDHPKWAKKYRTEDGAARLAEAAIAVLERFGLVRTDGEVVRALPAIARYSADMSEHQDGDGS